MKASDTLIDERALSKLRWGCRRGLLENDLFIERFFACHASSLTETQAEGLRVLMSEADNDLLDLFLCRKEPQDALDRPDVHEVLGLIRSARTTLNTLQENKGFAHDSV